MTIAQGIIAVQDAVGDVLTARTGAGQLMTIITALGDYGSLVNADLPYAAFGAFNVEEDDARVIGESLGTRARYITLELWIMDDAPSKLRSLNALADIESALVGASLSLSHGTAIAPPEIKLGRPVVDDALGLWRMPVEVKQLVDNL